MAKSVEVESIVAECHIYYKNLWPTTVKTLQLYLLSNLKQFFV